MKHIVLYGGSFNPVTLGHVEVAKYVVEAVQPDEFWFLPCFSSMWGKNVEFYDYRLKMLRLHLTGDPEINPDIIKVNDFEIRHEIRGSTFEMLKELRKEYPLEEYRFSFLMGMDNANAIGHWENGQEFIDSIPVIVVNRPHYRALGHAQWYFEAPHIYLEDSKGDNISSTEAREALTGVLYEGRSVKPTDYMHVDVVEFAKRRYLYPRTPYDNVEGSCFFCRNQALVKFHEHYLFCPDCSAIYTQNCIIDSVCGHIKGRTPTVIREPWYKNKRENADPYITETPITHRRICSVCAEEVVADGW